ncbi:MAG: RsfS/YbeB/iojap family protein [Collinsella sp.]
MLMDYSSVVVHVFTPEARDFYASRNSGRRPSPSISLVAHLRRGLLPSRISPGSCGFPAAARLLLPKVANLGRGF